MEKRVVSAIRSAERCLAKQTAAEHMDCGARHRVSRGTVVQARETPALRVLAVPFGALNPEQSSRSALCLNNGWRPNIDGKSVRCCVDEGAVQRTVQKGHMGAVSAGRDPNRIWRQGQASASVAAPCSQKGSKKCSRTQVSELNSAAPPPPPAILPLARDVPPHPQRNMTKTAKK